MTGDRAVFLTRRKTGMRFVWLQVPPHPELGDAESPSTPPDILRGPFSTDHGGTSKLSLIIGQVCRRSLYVVEP